MAKWTVERFASEMEKCLGSGLLGLVLYGSRAAGDHLEESSDINLMALVDSLGLAQLRILSGTVSAWVAQGNPPPLLLTPAQLKAYAEVFPLEISDMQQNHRVILGKDPFAGLDPSRDRLRQELEHELQGKLLQLKTRYLLTRGKDGPVKRLMAGSLSTFLVLLKNALWLYGEKPPLRKMEAVAELGGRLGVKTQVFATVELLKRGERFPAMDIPRIFEEYLTTLETLTEKLDG